MSKIRIPLYKRLYEEIRQKIIRNEYKKNQKLESVRSLSARLGISTTTVEKAYNQLLVEGYVTSKPRSGYIVQSLSTTFGHQTFPHIEPIQYPYYENNNLTTDLFDIKLYKSIINKVLNYDSEKLFAECDPRGEHELREEIRKYVLQERGIACDVNQIVIGSGIQNLLHILHAIEPKKSVCYLSPKFEKAMDVFETHGYTLKGKQTIYDITRTKADYLYISPSNTYPTGDIIQIKDRDRLIRWAQQNDSYIIEDDYNFFIRYNSYVIPSIYAHNHGKNVIYMGSFSKLILPSLRISYMILPENLYDKYRKLYHRFSQGVSKLDQLSLAQFMNEGLLKRHSKKLYTKYKEKNELLISALQTQQKRMKFDILSTDSNLHVVLSFQSKLDFEYFIKNCGSFELKYTKIPNSNDVIFPYSGIENKDIPSLIKNLFYKI